MRTHKQSLTADIAAIKAQLASVLAMLTKLIEDDDEPDNDAASFTIPEFCKRNRLSERQYYKLRAEGRGPLTMLVGDVGVRISVEAEADWKREREAEAAEAASLVRNERAPESEGDSHVRKRIAGGPASPPGDQRKS